MIVDTERIRLYCYNYELIENYQEAISSPEKWDCHHRKETDEGISMTELKERKLYYHRPPEELIFLPHSTHMSLHNKGKISPWKDKNLSNEHKHKIGESIKGKCVGQKHYNYKHICPTLLKMLYFDQHKNIFQISKELGFSYETIKRKINKLK